MAVLRAAWRLLLAAAVMSCLAALVLQGPGGGAFQPDELRERTPTLREALEQHDRKDNYLGNRHGLTAEAARKKANGYFDTEIHTAMKLKARHNLRRKGLGARAARNDLSDFFDTLGLTKSHERRRTRVDVHEKRVVEHHTKEVHPKTTVNVYINEETKQKKAQLKAHALNKKIKEAKSFRDEGKKDGLPLPLALQPKPARQQQLAEKPASQFDKEMEEAKSLLKSSKMERALSEARTLSLKADAPYYTSR